MDELAKVKKDIATGQSELTKIRAEINALLAEKSQIVKDINIPLLKAKAEADTIIKSAKEEAEITKKAADKILKEAETTHTFYHDTLRQAKGELEKSVNERKKLEQDKADFDGLKFAHENTVRQLRNATSQIEAQNRADSENVQRQLIEIKGREDAMARRELSVKTAENSLNELNTTLEGRKAILDALQTKLGLLENALADKESGLEREKAELLKIREDGEVNIKANKTLLEDIITQKNAIIEKQNNLARQIELYDNSKADIDDRMKTLKEKERLITIKMRQNDEKINTIKQLRGE